MSILEIILVAVGSYVFLSIIVTLAVTRFMRRVNRAAPHGPVAREKAFGLR